MVIVTVLCVAKSGVCNNKLAVVAANKGWASVLGQVRWEQGGRRPIVVCGGGGEDCPCHNLRLLLH